MGNNSNGLQKLPSRFQQLGVDQNQLLSTLIIVNDTLTQQKLLIKQVNLASDVEYERLLKELRQRKILSDKKIGKYLVRLRQIESREQSDICGKNFKLLLYLQYLNGNLKMIFQDRVRTRRHFSQSELILFIKSVVNGLIILHDNSFKNIHLCKESIVLSAHNHYKIVDTQLCNRVHPYFEILNGIPPKQGTYLAPQLMADIRKGNLDFYHSPKSDLFALAVLVLDLANLQSFDSLFDYEKMEIDIKKLRQITNHLGVSQFLKDLLLSMLEQYEQQRIGLLSLQELIASGDVSSCKSIADTQRNFKQSARSFISRSKPTTLKKSERQFQQKKETGSNPHFDPTNKQQAVGQCPIYTPINVIASKNQSQGLGEADCIQRTTTIGTPQSKQSIGMVFCETNSKSFDTPVNMLVQYHSEAVMLKKMDQIPKMNPRKHHQPIISYQSQSETHQCSSETLKIGSYPISQTDQVKVGPFKNKKYRNIQFANGARYEGELNFQEQFQGNGMLYYPNGRSCYSGSWKSNCFHGFGVLHSENPDQADTETPYQEFSLTQTNWVSYEGQFNMDHKSGFGTLYMANGDKFSGCFKNDSIQGFGTFFCFRQQRNINGIWVNNKLKH